jgi:hypothetical protein
MQPNNIKKMLKYNKNNYKSTKHSTTRAIYIIWKSTVLQRGQPLPG